MISVTRWSGDQVFINPDLIQMVRSSPETLIEFRDGAVLRVKESPDEVCQSIFMYKKSLVLQIDKVREK